VGARGDSDSEGNGGIQVDIRTHIEDVVQPDIAESFWVGDILVNGAFIQFGYELVLPNSYCLYGEQIGANTNCFGWPDNIRSGDARWFWEYWPNASSVDFYFGVGPGYSAGPDGSWHTYQIVPNVANGWNFVLDGKLVQRFNNYPPTTSKDAVLIVAEEVTSATSASGNLGPVEFRNLEYLKDGGWQFVTSLTAISECNTSNQLGVSPNCGINIPYGVSLNGPNDIIAGSGQNEVLTGTVLWTSSLTLTLQVPSQVQITLDGVSQNPGQIQAALPIGTHYVSVPSFVQLSNETRLRFIEWNESTHIITDPNITINLSSDYSLSAVYVTQYKLTLAASPYSPASEAWCDSGSPGTFSITPNNQFSIMFVGWYDESGNLITASSSGSILMDAPHTVVPEWRVNYVLIAIFMTSIIAIAFVGISWRRSRNKSGKRCHG